MILESHMSSLLLAVHYVSGSTYMSSSIMLRPFAPHHCFGKVGIHILDKLKETSDLSKTEYSSR